MLNADVLKDSHYLVQVIPYIFAILSLVGLYLGVTTNEEVCRAHFYRGLLLVWAVFIFPVFASQQTILCDRLAIAHTSGTRKRALFILIQMLMKSIVILYIILPFDLIFGALKAVRGRVAGSVNVKSELPKWETAKSQM